MEKYAFSTTATPEPPNILQGETPQKFLKERYTRGCIFGLDHLMRSGTYRLAGWSFNFRPYLKKYITKQYDHLAEQYAPNRTALRNATYGRIDILCELPTE